MPLQRNPSEIQGPFSQRNVVEGQMMRSGTNCVVGLFVVVIVGGIVVVLVVVIVVVG